MAKTPNPALVTVALSAVAALGYIGYRVLIEEYAGPPAQPEQAAPTAAKPALADAMPNFSMDNLDGEPTSIGTWADKPLLINFWATWCGPCRKEIPMLKEFQTQHPSLQVVGIAVDRAPAVKSYAEQMQFNYPILVGEAPAMDAAAAMGVNVIALPFTVFVDPQGRLLGVHTGELHPEHLANLTAVLTDLNAGRIDIDAARKRIAGRM